MVFDCVSPVWPGIFLSWIGWKRNLCSEFISCIFIVCSKHRLQTAWKTWDGSVIAVAKTKRETVSFLKVYGLWH
jgi:hypothetical protein